MLFSFRHKKNTVQPKFNNSFSERHYDVMHFWNQVFFIFFYCSLSMEICDERNNITMCPMCDRACSYWKLVTACGTARASHLFDNAATVFFAIFMALWGQQLCSPFIFTRTLCCCCTPTVMSVHIEGRLDLANVGRDLCPGFTRLFNSPVLIHPHSEA